MEVNENYTSVEYYFIFNSDTRTISDFALCLLRDYSINYAKFIVLIWLATRFKYIVDSFTTKLENLYSAEYFIIIS